MPSSPVKGSRGRAGGRARAIGPIGAIGAIDGRAQGGMGKGTQEGARTGGMAQYGMGKGRARAREASKREDDPKRARCTQPIGVSQTGVSQWDARMPCSDVPTPALRVISPP